MSPNDMQMKGLRRNEVAMKLCGWYLKKKMVAKGSCEWQIHHTPYIKHLTCYGVGI